MTLEDAGLASQPPHHPSVDRRRFLLTSLAGALAAPLGAGAQPGRVYTVGTLSIGAPAHPDWWQPFVDAMRELDYIEVLTTFALPSQPRGRPATRTTFWRSTGL